MTRTRGAAWLAAACAMAALPARAALWTAEPSVELACGADDNYGLAIGRRDRVGKMSLNGGLVASRKTESVSTSLDARAAGLLLRGDLHQDEWQDSLALDHAFTGERDSWSLGARTTRDDTRQAPGGSADLLIGRGVQRSHDAHAGWTYAVTERLSTVAALGFQRTRYSSLQAGARDFRNASGSGSLRYLVDERSSVNLAASHQDYRTLDGAVRSQTDSLTLGGTRALGEAGSAALSLGAYRSRTTALSAVLVCSAACEAGTAGPVVAIRPGHVARWGLQYNGSLDAALSETTRLSAAAARQQDPSGVGATVRSDSLRAGLDQAFSETLSGTLSWSRASSTVLGGTGGPQARLQAIGVLLSKSLSERLTLRANADWKHSSQSLSGGHDVAHSTSVALTLRYEWQRLEAHR